MIRVFSSFFNLSDDVVILDIYFEYHEYVNVECTDPASLFYNLGLL